MSSLVPSPVSKNTALEMRPQLARAVFDACVMRVLASRNEAVPASDVLNLWYAEARAFGFSDDQFKEAAVRVVRSKPFGATKFSEFCEGEKTYTQSEVEELLVRCADARLESFSRLDKEALKVEAIREAKLKAFADIERFRDGFRDEFNERVRKAQEWYASATVDDRLEVAEMVKRARPALGKDAYWSQHWQTMTRMCIADVVDEVEAYQKAIEA